MCSCKNYVLMSARQVALADIILINKTDLVSREQLKDVEERIWYGVILFKAHLELLHLTPI